VSTRDVFSEQELARLRGFPEITAEDVIRFFTLSSADEAFARASRGATAMLGRAVQLCTLPWLGYVPDDVTSAPTVAVARLAERLGVDPGDLAGYGAREQTRTDHLRAVMGYRGWRSADERELWRWFCVRWTLHPDQGVGELAFPGGQQRREQGQPQLLGVAAQM